MPIRYRKIVFLFHFICFSAFACYGQTDIAASGLGAFSVSSNGGGTGQTQSDAAGGLLEFRHIWNPGFSFEVTYSYNRANQVYVNNGPVPAVCVVNTCAGLPRIPVSANANEFTADWMPTKTTGALRPFAVLGGGVLMVVPSGGQSNTTTATKPVFVFGLGMDWARWKRVGLRFQYRGNLYSAPLLTTQYASTGSLMLTNEPMVGVYFRLP